MTISAPVFSDRLQRRKRRLSRVARWVLGWWTVVVMTVASPPYALLIGMIMTLVVAVCAWRDEP